MTRRAWILLAALGVAAVLLLIAGFGAQGWKGQLALAGIAIAAAGLWAGRTVIGDLWLLRISRAEFGVSDLQANYTRTYAWMANQLGHFTLGLGTALAYLWLVEGLQEALGHLTAPPAGAALTGPVAAAAVTGLAAAVMWRRLSGLGPAPLDAAEGAVPATAPLRRATAFFTVMLLLGAVAATWPTAQVARAAGLVFAVAVALAALDQARRRGDAGAARPHQPGGCRGLWLIVLAAALGAFAVWFFAIAMLAPGGAWADPDRLAGIVTGMGAAFVSLAVWGTKEFGNDQRGILTELQRARTLRGPDCPAREAGLRLREEGLWDSIADGFFYVTGAVLAVGIIASPPRLGDGFVQSGWELGAVAFFTAMMLLLGRRYAYRARAIDLTGVPYACRLGLVEVPVTVVAGRDRLTPRQDLCDLDALGLAMSALDRNAAPLPPIVVFGRRGAGKSPLVIALACEAGLSPLPVSLCARFPDGAPERIRVRYAAYDRARLDEAADPVAIRHAYRSGIDNPLLVDGQLLWDLARADVAVIDNIPWRALGFADGALRPVPRLARLIAALSRSACCTIWAIDPPPEPAGDGSERVQDATLQRAAEAFAAHLAAATPGPRRDPEAILVRVGDSRARRCAMLEALWRAIDRPDSPPRRHDAVCPPAAGSRADPQ